LTFILPAYRRQDFLNRALHSIGEQDVAPSRVIVVDDGSEPALRLPDTLNLPHCELVRRLVNGGPAAARNTGLSLSRTEWISFLDSDDVLAPRTLGLRWQQVMALQAKGAGERIISGCSWADVSPELRQLRVRHPLPGTAPRDFAGGCWFSPGSCIIMNGLAAVEAVGYQDEALRRLEDIDWFLALSLKGFRFYPQKDVGAYIEMKRVQKPARILDAARAIERKWTYTLPASLFRRLKSYLQLECAAAYYYAGEHAVAASHLARSILFQPRLQLQLSPGWCFRAELGPAGGPI
jgi:glycosyltransferase involved in cell wall biosynthesis